MRVVPALLAGGLAAAAFSTATPAQAADHGWTQTSRVAFFSATGLRQGEMVGHPGNWHSIVVSVNGSDGVSGEVTDWTCADGVVPDLAGEDSGCVAESRRTVTEARDADGASLVRVAVNRPARNLEVSGRLAVVDEAGVESVGWIHLVGHAYGAGTRDLVESEDGLTRTFTITRDRTRAVGRLLGIRVHGRDFETTSSSLVSVTTWVKSSAGRRVEW